MLEISKPGIEQFHEKSNIIPCKNQNVVTCSLCCCSRLRRESRSRSQSLEAASSPPCPRSSVWKKVCIEYRVNINGQEKYLKMPIRTARRGGARAREEPTQLKLIQSHLEKRIRRDRDLRRREWMTYGVDIDRFIENKEKVDLIWRRFQYNAPLTCITVSGVEVKVRKQEKGSMSPLGRPTDTEYRPPSSPV